MVVHNLFIRISLGVMLQLKMLFWLPSSSHALTTTIPLTMPCPLPCRRHHQPRRRSTSSLLANSNFQNGLDDENYSSGNNDDDASSSSSAYVQHVLNNDDDYYYIDYEEDDDDRSIQKYDNTDSLLEVLEWSDDDDDWIELYSENADDDDTTGSLTTATAATADLDGADEALVQLPNILTNNNNNNLTNNNNNSNNPSTLVLQDLESNLSYFYLKNELGLSEPDMWKITYEAPSALGMTAATLRHKVHVLTEAMNLTRPELQGMIRTAPAILHLSADKKMAPNIFYLLRLLDLSRHELKQMILACPALLGYKKDNLKAKVHFFTDILHYTVPQTRALLLKEPKLWRSSVSKGLIPHVRFLCRDVELDRHVLAHQIVPRNPKILLYSRHDNLVPKLIFYGIMTLHMEPHHVQKLLTKYPQWLDYNLERCILPLTRYFLQDLEFGPTEFRAMLLAYPKLVTHSLFKVKHTVGFFRYEVGLTGAQVKRVLYQAPQVLGMKDASVREKIYFLQRALGLGDNADEDQDSLTNQTNESNEQQQQSTQKLQKILVGMPRLLVLNIDKNLQPKVQYLLDEAFDGDVEALQQAVVKLPTLLAYSLEKRIQPRVRAILDVNLAPSTITVGITYAQPQFDAWLSNQTKKQIEARRRQEASNRPPPQPVMDPSSPILHWTRPRRPRAR